MNKEFALRQTSKYENEFPSTLDFVLLYIRLVKLSSGKIIGANDLAIDFIQAVEKCATKFCTCVLIDVAMLKYKPSVLAAAFVFIGF